MSLMLYKFSTSSKNMLQQWELLIAIDVIDLRDRA